MRDLCRHPIVIVGLYRKKRVVEARVTRFSAHLMSVSEAFVKVIPRRRVAEAIDFGRAGGFGDSEIRKLKGICDVGSCKRMDWGRHKICGLSSVS